MTKGNTDRQGDLGGNLRTAFGLAEVAYDEAEAER